MMAFAFGVLRIEPRVFGRMTLQEFELAVEGWLDHEERERDWAAVRALCVIEACAMNRVNLREMADRMTGGWGEPDFREEDYAEMLEESRARVKKKRQEQLAHGR